MDYESIIDSKKDNGLSKKIKTEIKKEDEDSDSEYLYKNEFRVQKAKKLRFDEFPELKDISFKIDEDDNFIVDLENAFMIHKRILLFNIIRKVILPNEGKLFDTHIEELMSLLDDEDHR